MPNYHAPGVYIEEVDRGAKPIEGVGTSTAGFLGQTERGPVAPEHITSFPDFERKYGGFDLYKPNSRLSGTYLAYAVEGFFANGGTECYVGRIVPEGTDTARTTLPPASEGVPSGFPTLSTARLDFGTVVDESDATRTVRLENPPADDGGRAIPYENVVLSDVGPNFTVTDDRGDATEFGPGSQLTITVEANRTPGPRRRTATLTVTPGESPAVSADLVADVPTESEVDHTLGTDQLFVDAGTVRFGDDPGSVNVPIENLTDATIPSTEVTVSIDNDTQPDVFSTEFDSEIPTDNPATVTVNFTPTHSDTALFEGTLRVNHNGVEQFTVRLRGAFVSNFQATDELEVQRGSPATLTIENTDTDNPVPREEVQLTLVSGDTNAFRLGDVPGEIGADDSIDVSVDLTAEDTRPRRATLQISRVQQVDGAEVRYPPVLVTLVGNPTNSPVDAAAVTAVGPGQWGEHVALLVSEGSLSTDDSPRRTFTLRYWAESDAAAIAKANGANPEKGGVPTPDVEEVYDNLSATQSSSDYYVNVLNSASRLVRLTEKSSSPPAVTSGPTWLSGDFESVGETKVSDYVGSSDPALRTGLRAFETVDEIAIVCIPDERNDMPGNTDPKTGLTGKLVEHCESLKDRFAVLQAPVMAGSLSSLDRPVDSKYAAFYYPWVSVPNPETGGSELVPPGGHVCGIYARSDTERGVHKAPANEPVRNVSQLQFQVTQSEQKVLNPRGVNCLRSFPGRGIRVWGARTTSSDPAWKYVNVRRLFLYVEESIDEATQWVVFEPNNEMLWARVRQSVGNFLTTVWRTGALMGTSPEEAFFVKCDRTTMTQDDIDNGRLIVEIGIAPTKPAEFVIFRISQVASGAEGS